ncbi:glycoside hydrolase family 26 protein [Gonapodya prolifera JEL478]|uniref:Glycoside hydrolase family 26 protein n=1 Tax=Gonapodya prolifera (strain JEL478) TaxID=1344416 RepID=A0A139A4K5_GONPJ|nr:glycoside hydrolase family 26 protein [Gonapodya prolifera JEL478]|eukprot:KXS11757.1 glycoside hydrolase family 26 protein [Gonapodya prolifera JEL478]
MAAPQRSPTSPTVPQHHVQLTNDDMAMHSRTFFEHSQSHLNPLRAPEFRLDSTHGPPSNLNAQYYPRGPPPPLPPSAGGGGGQQQRQQQQIGVPQAPGASSSAASAVPLTVTVHPATPSTPSVPPISPVSPSAQLRPAASFSSLNPPTSYAINNHTAIPMQTFSSTSSASSYSPVPSAFSPAPSGFSPVPQGTSPALQVPQPAMAPPQNPGARSPMFGAIFQRGPSPSPSPAGSYSSLPRSDMQLIPKGVGDGGSPQPRGPRRRRTRRSKISWGVAIMVTVGLLFIGGAVTGAVFYVITSTRGTTPATAPGSTASVLGSSAIAPIVSLAVPPVVAPVSVPMTTANPQPLPPPGPRGVNPVTLPATGVILGAHLDFATDTPGAFNARLALPGGNVTTFMAFITFPITDFQGTLDYIFNTVVATMPRGGILILSVEPTAGLGSVTAASAADLAEVCRRVNAAGTAVLVRFAHEMNGGWYIWGGKPTAYKTAYRVVADAVHGSATRTGMLWSPNNALSYPWTGGAYFPQPGSTDYTSLDTNGDGTVTAADDPFTPYWPGDEYVDFVGTSLFFLGLSFPYGANNDAPAGYYENILIGTNFNTLVNNPIQNLYTFTTTHNKPFVIAETGIFHNPNETTGATNLEQKQSWWRQVFTNTFLSRYPMIRVLNLFEVATPQTDFNGTIINFSVTRDTPEILAGFQSDWNGEGFILSSNIN